MPRSEPLKESKVKLAGLIAAMVIFTVFGIWATVAQDAGVLIRCCEFDAERALLKRLNNTVPGITVTGDSPSG